MMELTEDFVKMLQIAFLVVGTLSIFLIFISYNIDVNRNDSRREALLFLESLLTNDCLVVERNNRPVKALFSAEKLDEMVADASCIDYPYGKIQVWLVDETKDHWIIFLGESDDGAQTENFNIAIDTGSDGIKAGNIKVFL